MTELILALGAGLLSFLSPCVLPLIPGYISYVSGKSLNELLEEKKVNVIPIVLFTVGFSLIFIAFGATSSLIGKILLNNSIELRILSGLVIIFFSLQIIGIVNLNFLNFEKRFETQKSANNFGSISLLIIPHCICSVLGPDDIDISVIAINISLLLDNVSASSNACFSLGL